MKLKWMGHACFKLTTDAGTRIVIDPYDENTGYGTLTTTADLLITSHGHHDHCNVQSVKGYEKRIDAEGCYEFRDVKVETLKSYHDALEGAKRGTNLLIRIEADGQSVVHLGDLGHEPDAAQLAFISGADVLLIPIGGFFTIDTDQAIRIIEKAAPKAIVPMHFKTARNEYPISTSQEFSERMKPTALEQNEVEVAKLKGPTILQWSNQD